MIVIWGTNFAIIKTAFRELEPQAFNAMRMLIASLALLAVMLAVRLWPSGRQASAEDVGPGVFRTPATITPREWLTLAWLGVVGHALYQYFFIGGLARTTVANSSLMLAATPVVITIMSAAIGHERVGRRHWLGAGVSVLGIYLVAGQGATFGGAGTTGDLMMLGAVCCWAVYTLGTRELMKRHSPVGVTALSMALGTAAYLPLVWSNMRAVDWTHVSGGTLFLVAYSAIFALCIAYSIWYVAVRRIGSARTAVYSNLIPVVAMTSAVIFLDEPIRLRKLLGAAAVLAGVALTRAVTTDNS
jgi:drug/metabolite transporter (DMT)-like permease